MNFIKSVIEKYKGLIMYGFFGVLTTLINIITYYLCSHILDYGTILSNILAWIVAVAFAFITNKIWVFESKSLEMSVLIKEVFSFTSCRLLTGAMDMLFMYVFVDLLFFNDIFIKVISNILVIILNYIGSKLWVFKKGDSN